jgi:hypothetical protein
VCHAFKNVRTTTSGSRSNPFCFGEEEFLIDIVLFRIPDFHTEEIDSRSLQTGDSPDFEWHCSTFDEVAFDILRCGGWLILCGGQQQAKGNHEFGKKHGNATFWSLAGPRTASR